MMQSCWRRLREADWQSSLSRLRDVLQPELLVQNDCAMVVVSHSFEFILKRLNFN